MTKGPKTGTLYTLRTLIGKSDLATATKEGIDFTEIFSPVVKMSSIRVILGLVATLDLECEQLDVKIAFFHGELEEEIYME